MQLVCGQEDATSYKLSTYLPVYMWRQANKVEGKDDFLELLALMSARQMQEDTDFDNAKVLIQITVM